ncbi:hypothetical protein HPB50_008349 [Hyalomma asiaticum]|uniref:Uncharacterized protein n=1 Tax=Hyalomma asiaticum TaxID=266040 RepID=A0ACB7SWC2_HYAAI|nr:hypothetical protein HPB50_008349 [Hyalomma asiaticum]
MIRRVSASAASSDARSFAADDRSRRLHDRERSVETRRRELLTAIMALVYCCTKSCDACGRSAEHFYTIPADNSGSGVVDKASRNGVGNLIDVGEVWVDGARTGGSPCQGDHAVFIVWCLAEDAKRLRRDAAFSEVSDG